MEVTPLLLMALSPVIAYLLTRGLDRRERRIATAAYVVGVVGALTNWFADDRGYVLALDANTYRGWGVEYARLVDSDFGRFAPELAKSVLHLPNDLPFEAPGAGTSTGTMSALAGGLVYLVGPSLLSMCLAAGAVSWFGMLCWYRVAREELGAGERTAALVAFFFVPSVVFWRTSYAKEAFLLGALGVLSLSVYRALERRSPLSVVAAVAGILAGGAGVAVTKPYTLFPFTIALAVASYTKRAWPEGAPIRIRPLYLGLVTATGIGVFVAMGALFPAYSSHNLEETITAQRDAWHGVHASGDAGGSDIELEGETASQQVAVGLVNALFRPFIFEARNPASFGAAVETTAITLAALWLLLRGARLATLGALARSPILVFSTIFTGLFAVAIGVTTGNLGTISRYRSPMMPFYVLTILVLARRAWAASSAPEPRAVAQARLLAMARAGRGAFPGGKASHS